MAKGKNVAGEKRKQHTEDPVLESPRPMDPRGFMATLRAEVRAEEGHQRR